VNQTFFHLAFIGVALAFFFVRAYYHRLATRTGGEVEFKEGKVHNGLRKVFGIPFMLAVLVFLVRPDLFAWADLPLPTWAQWTGLLLGFASVPLVWWVHQALGANFSTTLHVRSEHTLVTTGPYRWVRHPMYTVLYIHLASILLLTRNWFVGGLALVALTVIVVVRLKKEEAAMSEKFGPEYRAYMKRTGRFLPRLLAAA
jgi:protein-S-isoprenylcysteine O-methyltransferase Ste14